MYMTVGEYLPLAEVRSRLSEVVDEVEREHARVTITKHGRPAAILISPDDLESLEETLSLLSNPAVMADIQESQASPDGYVRLTKDEALREFLGSR